MILRKPYAFFIKFFRLFHLIMFVLGSFLLYRTSSIYVFLKEYVNSGANVIGRNLVGPLFSKQMYFFIILLLLLNILIIIVLIRKDKPYAFYVYSISLYIFIFVMFFISRRVIGNLEVMLVAAKTTMAVRDIMNILRLLETVCIIFYLIRATGFDIRKFDFARDLHALNISDEDSEEYEVAVDFESNVLFRKINKYLRSFKYYFKENKFIIIVCFLAFVCLISFIIYFSINKYNRSYGENDFFNVSGYTIGVRDSYVVNKSYNGSELFDNEYSLIVVKSSLKGFNKSVSSNRFILVVDGSFYYHSNSYSSYVSDLGNVYNDDILSNEYSDYLFVYKIPKILDSHDMTFRYIDSVGTKNNKTYVKSIDVKLSPKNIDNFTVFGHDYELGELDLSDVFSDYKVNLHSFDISNQFIIGYNACVRAGECYDFKEILRPSIDSNKVLLKVNGSVDFKNSIGGVNDLYSLINRFGSIDFVSNGVNYSYSDNFKLVTSNKSAVNDYYIEVDSKILNASSIKLCFNFRNSKYCYVLRGDINA